MSRFRKNIMNVFKADKDNKPLIDSSTPSGVTSPGSGMRSGSFDIPTGGGRAKRSMSMSLTVSNQARLAAESIDRRKAMDDSMPTSPRNVNPMEESSGRAHARRRSRSNSVGLDFGQPLDGGDGVLPRNPSSGPASGKQHSSKKGGRFSLARQPSNSEQDKRIGEITISHPAPAPTPDGSAPPPPVLTDSPPQRRRFSMKSGHTRKNRRFSSSVKPSRNSLSFAPSQYDALDLQVAVHKVFKDENQNSYAQFNLGDILPLPELPGKRIELGDGTLETLSKLSSFSEVDEETETEDHHDDDATLAKEDLHADDKTLVSISDLLVDKGKSGKTNRLPSFPEDGDVPGGDGDYRKNILRRADSDDEVGFAAKLEMLPSDDLQPTGKKIRRHSLTSTDMERELGTAERRALEEKDLKRSSKRHSDRKSRKGESNHESRRRSDEGKSKDKDDSKRKSSNKRETLVRSTSERSVLNKEAHSHSHHASKSSHRKKHGAHREEGERRKDGEKERRKEGDRKKDGEKDRDRKKDGKSKDGERSERRKGDSDRSDRRKERSSDEDKKKSRSSSSKESNARKKGESRPARRRSSRGGRSSDQEISITWKRFSSDSVHRTSLDKVDEDKVVTDDAIERTTSINPQLASTLESLGDGLEDINLEMEEIPFASVLDIASPKSPKMSDDNDSVLKAPKTPPVIHDGTNGGKPLTFSRSLSFDVQSMEWAGSPDDVTDAYEQVKFELHESKIRKQQTSLEIVQLERNVEKLKARLALLNGEPSDQAAMQASFMNASSSMMAIPSPDELRP